MKKFIFLGTFCLTCIPLMAQSTCETRVDAHQEATTKQRVAYCLTPDYATPTQTDSNLLFSSVSSPSTQKPAKKEEKPTAKAGEFQPQRYTVTQEFVDSTQFPQMPQGNTFPASVSAPENQPETVTVTVQQVENPVSVANQETFQEEVAVASEVVGVVPVAQPQVVAVPVDPNAAVLMQDEFEYVAAPSTPLGRSEIVWVKPTRTPAVSTTMGTASALSLTAPREHFMIDEVDENGNLVVKTQLIETKSGLKARQNKPARQLIKAAETESKPAATMEVPAQEPAYTYHEDLTKPYKPEEIPAGTASYAPATPANTTSDEIPAGTVSYAPATVN